ncbi:MAG: flavodoxin family protein [Acidobacteria bacterium]|nr:flavodoxin family protein [Acidobacteriota bacterium]
MKRVTAFVASAREKHTYNAVRQFLDSVQSVGDVESEIVVLSDYDVQTCRGCKTCFDRGEEYCPFKDDRNALIDKMMSSDGVVFASPTYSFQVSAIMKIFLDRLGFAFHRPRFFGKTFTSIVVQAFYGGPKAVEYLDFVGDALGFNVVKGSCVNSLEPMTHRQHRTNDRVLRAHSTRFHDRLSRPSLPAPTFLHLMMFRMGRTKVRLLLDESWRDYTYYRDKGWFEADYFYPVRLSPFKKAAGHLFDYSAARSAKN